MESNTKAFSSLTEGIQRTYREKLLPVERASLYNQFYSCELTDADFVSKPMVMVIGQYSTGKSTFIRQLIGQDYPGMRIGPEPTTDKFVAISYGSREQKVPGNTVVADKSQPFTELSTFGNAFLDRFESARLPNPVLEDFTLIDTPGVLASEKDRQSRGYPFDSVVEWFADRADVILVLFDTTKMDISDEFRRVLVALRSNESKMHIVLNKADLVTSPQLMRVYGAMMWSLGKVIDVPEVSRVYIGSFGDEPISNEEQRQLYEAEKNDLYTKLMQLPRNVTIRKIDDLMKRLRLIRVHMFVLDYLRKRMPIFNKVKAQENLIANLPTIFKDIEKEYTIPAGDFPSVEGMQRVLAGLDFAKFPKLDGKGLVVIEEMLTTDIPQLICMVPAEIAASHEADQLLFKRVVNQGKREDRSPVSETSTGSTRDTEQRDERQAQTAWDDIKVMLVREIACEEPCCLNLWGTAWQGR
jgi:GTPase SAR1 family protein